MRRLQVLLACGFLSLAKGQNFQWSSSNDDKRPWPLGPDSRSHQAALQQQQQQIQQQGGPSGQPLFSPSGPNQLGPGAPNQQSQLNVPSQQFPQQNINPSNPNWNSGQNFPQQNTLQTGQQLQSNLQQAGQQAGQQLGNLQQAGQQTGQQLQSNLQQTGQQAGQHLQQAGQQLQGNLQQAGQQTGQQFQQLGDKIVDLTQQGRQQVGTQLQQFGQQIQQPGNQILPGQTGQQVQQAIGQGTQFLGQQISPGSPQQGNSGPNQGNPGPNQGNFGSNQGNFLPNQGNTNQIPGPNIGAGPGQVQQWPAGSNPQWTGQQSNQPFNPTNPQWFGDPNRPQDAQVWPNQQVGPNIHTSADKTVMVGASPWNNQQPPPAGWSGPLPYNNQPQNPIWQPPGQPAGSFNPMQQSGFNPNQQGWQNQQNVQAPWQQQQQWPNQPGRPNQWQQQAQFGAPTPLWVPGQQGWVTNPPPPMPSTISTLMISTTPAIEDSTEEILRDLVAYHVGGAFPRDEIRQYNAKVPMPRQHRDYWLGELYYNLDPASQLQGKIKCTYNLPPSMSRLHYDDGTPIGIIVFQCVQFQERCCNLDCCNLYAKTPPPQQPFRYPGGVSCTCANWLIIILLLLISFRQIFR